ncbi:MarR family transcriptional regulator [Heliobacterium chlorum]|uniref:MarR family transcriptional regulator n=1 Tax=Heliobacterium chlorum TaxID=2698 RepID=A0ABR7T3I1_HELCL|nr:MarR family transcriptional regulator [Heliobacterium chlorum]MBC9784404.1 MarR family transcriptional regulator [Heliobacterium chlorum]
MTTETETAQRLLQAFMQFKRVEWHRRSVLGYKPSEMKLLFCILRGEKTGSPALKVSEISQLLQVTPPTVTQLIKELEASGLVERSMDPSDRRSVRIRLTQKGSTVTKQARNEFVNSFHGLVEYLGEAESRQLADLLTQAFRYFTTKEATENRPSVQGEDERC